MAVIAKKSITKKVMKPSSPKNPNLSRKSKNWRKSLENLHETLKNDLDIDEVLDLSIAMKMMEKTIFEKVQKHYGTLHFEYLNEIELIINDDKMEIFEISSFLEFLIPYNISIKYATFHNFPVDQKLVREIQEMIGKVSRSQIQYTVIDDRVTVLYQTLLDISEKACNSMESFEIFQTSVEQNLYQIFEDHQNSTDFLKLEMCSLDLAEFPKDVLKILLRVLSPAHLEITFSPLSAPVFPQHPNYQRLPKFNFTQHSFHLIFPNSLESCQVFMSSETELHKNYVISNMRMVGGVNVTVFGLRIEHQVAYFNAQFLRFIQAIPGV